MIQNLQPLTLTPLFYWLPGSSTVSRIRSEAPDLRPGLCHRVNLSGGSGPASFHVGPEPNRPSLHLSASISQLLAVWWSLNLSGHYSPPSASTSHPSSLCALFNPAVSLAPSPHNSALSQQITVFPLHLCSNCALSLSLSFCPLSTHDLVLFPVHSVSFLLVFFIWPQCREWKSLNNYKKVNFYSKESTSGNLFANSSACLEANTHRFTRFSPSFKSLRATEAGRDMIQLFSCAFHGN